MPGPKGFTEFDLINPQVDPKLTDQISDRMNAAAFTKGAPLYFDGTSYSCGTTSESLLAHEAAHVVQQGGR